MGWWEVYIFGNYLYTMEGVLHRDILFIYNMRGFSVWKIFIYYGGGFTSLDIIYIQYKGWGDWLSLSKLFIYK